MKEKKRKEKRQKETILTKLQQRKEREQKEEQLFSHLSMIKKFKPSPTDLKDTLGGKKQRRVGKVEREERYIGKKYQFVKNV